MDRDVEQIREALRALVRIGDKSGYERLYAEAQFDPARVPWADLVADPNVVHWLDRENVQGNGRTALVVGCGLGDDAEELVGRGFDVTAFDISPTAIEWCRGRFPKSRVRYAVADLLEPPPKWTVAFDFVLEVFTLQALSPQYRPGAIERVSRFVAPGGELLIICRARDESDPPGDLPYPLLKRELQAVEQLGLRLRSLEDFLDDEDPPVRRFRAHYRR